MSLFSMSFIGGALILLGSYESLSSPKSSKRFSTITLISTLTLSLLLLTNSFISLLNATSLNDTVGTSLQLQLLSISSLFLLFSLLGLLTSSPYPLLNLILLFAFLEEFLLFHLHFKDPNGIENRYFDLMLVPILICIVSTVIELLSSSSSSINGEICKLGRGLGLILQGSWFIQMGFSFFSDLIAENCSLYYKSRGNYTIRCKSHMDGHRGGAIAVLLFNCHVAFLVAVICGVFSVVGKRFVVDRSRYRRLGEEGMRVESQGKFTLDSDSDDGGGVVELSVNGNGSH